MQFFHVAKKSFSKINNIYYPKTTSKMQGSQQSLVNKLLRKQGEGMWSRSLILFVITVCVFHPVLSSKLISL